MKRDNKLQKLVAHTSIWLGKRESDLKIKSMMPKKPKACSSIECQKFQASISQWDVMIQKDQMLWRI